MRNRYKVLCICLLVWLIGCSGMAENRYDALCGDYTVVQEDATAWIEISGTKFCQPIMQHKTDDGFYAKHDFTGKESPYGALYTQATYNRDDFSDPVTIIYGSSKAQGTPFRDLQRLYSGRFEECREIMLHLPDETLRYRVFAAIPYSSVHILHYYNFDIEHRYDAFFKGVYSTRLLGMHLDAENRPKYGDKILILSTGIRGDDMQRYLVMAKRIVE